jgi:hypothetical protein
MAQESIVGQVPDASHDNNNSLGINPGLLDSRSLHAASFTAGYDTGTSNYGWVLSHASSGVDYLIPAAVSSNFTRYLCIPINGLPNGAQLISIQLQGNCSGNTLNATIYKRLVLSPFTTSASLCSLAISAAGSFGSGGTSSGLLTPLNSPQIIESAAYCYYATITLAGTGVSATNNVYSATINFRY